MDTSLLALLSFDGKHLRPFSSSDLSLINSHRTQCANAHKASRTREGRFMTVFNSISSSDNTLLYILIYNLGQMDTRCILRPFILRVTAMYLIVVIPIQCGGDSITSATIVISICCALDGLIHPAISTFSP